MLTMVADPDTGRGQILFEGAGSVYGWVYPWVSQADRGTVRGNGLSFSMADHRPRVLQPTAVLGLYAGGNLWGTIDGPEFYRGGAALRISLLENRGYFVEVDGGVGYSEGLVRPYGWVALGVEGYQVYNRDYPLLP
jgi:hypothetical protein